MPPRDTSPEAVARACAEMVREMLLPGQEPTPEHVELAALAIIRAERARVRRIVRRKLRAAEAAGQTVAAAYLRGILAALREGKGAKR